MELEYHTPYQIVKPNEKINGGETWEVIEFRKGNNSFEQIKLINIYLSLKILNNIEDM